MVEDSDAERIRRDRDQRRAAERLRIEDERRARQLELDRLRGEESSSSDSSRARESEHLPRVVRLLAPSRPVAPRAPTPAPSPPQGVAEPVPSRPIGGSVRPPSIVEFLKTDPTERFDILSLNTMRFPEIVSDSRGDIALLRTIGDRAEALMVRIKQELDDPLSAGAFLRDQVLRWYRESGVDPEWTTRMSGRLAGLFTESRTSGGRLEPWLNLRLWALRERTIRAGPFHQKVRRGLSRDRPAEAAIERSASQQILAEVAQAILDELSTHTRIPDSPLPLVRLSELAVRRQTATVNDALAVLFTAPESGPFIILHPNRYPDCDELVIRPPSPGASGAALAYSLGSGHIPHKPHSRDRRGVDSSAEGGAVDRGSGAGEGDEEELEGDTIWAAGIVSPKSWIGVVDDARRARRRLDPPPKDFRTQPAYIALRDLLLENGDFRKAFLAARWRGRPAGPALLATLLQKGSIAPEVSTDHEYLEAELGELAQGDPRWSPPDGKWTFGGWTVTREGSHGAGYRFRAQRSD